MGSAEELCRACVDCGLYTVTLGITTVGGSVLGTSVISVGRFGQEEESDEVEEGEESEQEEQEEESEEVEEGEESEQGESGWLD